MGKCGANRLCARVCILTAVVAALATQQVAHAQTPPPLGYSIKTISLTGPGYQYNSGGGFVRAGSGFPVNGPSITPAGYVAGATNRVSNTGTYLGRDAWFFNGASTQVIGFTGAGYEYAAAGGTFRDRAIAAMNDAGQVVGFNNRYSSGGASLGLDTWRFDGSSTQLISPTGAGYEYTDAAGTHRYALSQSIDSSGRVMGYALRYAADGTDLGQDAWRFDGTSTQLIGLSGAEYQYATASGTYRSGGAALNQSDPAGRILGGNSRYAADGTPLGSDAWLFNGTTTQRINLTGAVYEYSDAGGTGRDGYASGMNAAGQVYGHSSRYESNGDDLGKDVWLYNGTTTQAINLTGGVYESGPPSKPYREAEAWTISAGGHVLGYSTRFGNSASDLGRDTWVYNGTSTNLVNLTGAGYEYSSGGGSYRSSESQIISSSGRAAGTSRRYAADGTELGRDSWVYDGTATHLTSLIGPDYEYTDAAGTHRDSNPGGLAPNSSRAAGNSNRFSATGADLGRDSWYFDGVVSKRVNPTGGVYEYNAADGTHRLASGGMTDTGKLLGRCNRYSATGEFRGEAGWFYDPDTDLTTTLEFSISNTGFSETIPELMTDTGVVFGQFDSYSGNSFLGEHAFWWSDDDGFHDLGALAAGGIGPAGWQYLADVYSTTGTVAGGSPKYILGTGLATGEVQGSSPFFGILPPQTVFLLDAQVPEPASLSAIALFLLACGRRRKSGRRRDYKIRH